MFTISETDNWLLVKGKKMRLRKSSNRYKVYLDGTIARRPTDYLVNLLQKCIKREEHGSACTATTAHIWHQRLGHPNSRVLDATKKIEGAGVKFTGSIEPCDTYLVNKSKELSHTKETEHYVTQPPQFINTDILRPICPKSLVNFRYIPKFFTSTRSISRYISARTRTTR